MAVLLGLPMRPLARWLLWVSVLGVVATPPPAAAGHMGALDCGNLSPLNNNCEDPDPVPMSPHPVPSMNILGYEGRIRIELNQPRPTGVVAKMYWMCDALLVNIQPLSGCGAPQFEGPFFLPPEWMGSGPPVTLKCYALPKLVLGVPVPPAGQWGCHVHL